MVSTITNDQNKNPTNLTQNYDILIQSKNKSNNMAPVYPKNHTNMILMNEKNTEFQHKSKNTIETCRTKDVSTSNPRLSNQNSDRKSCSPNICNKDARNSKKGNSPNGYDLSLNTGGSNDQSDIKSDDQKSEGQILYEMEQRWTNYSFPNISKNHSLENSINKSSRVRSNNSKKQSSTKTKYEYSKNTLIVK